MCRLQVTMDIVGKLFSVVTLTCISVERYHGVRDTLHSASNNCCMNIAPLSLGIAVCVAIPAIPWAVYTDSYVYTYSVVD